ncbi:MAG TPA: low specificity L-threonine aldolase [Alphaproteobacteria bacterium]|jgi:threonine aldolase|nr:low specificity L-threonine aldolase [Alphaproteobacteria bacterium]
MSDSLASDGRRFDFRSDNVAGVAPEVLAALAEAAKGSVTSYGEDSITRRVEARLKELFGHELTLFTVATGTAANSLALAQLVPGWGSVLCHREAHIATDECGAPEFYSGGAKLAPLDGAHGKITAETVAAYLARDTRGVHHSQPMAISISQSTEAGTCYTPDEVAAIGAAGARHGVKFHMDGARFANALASLRCAPAEVTWQAGVDAMSFGVTKNGAMAAEAVIFFDPALAEDFGYRRKRGGHLFSKGRFAAAQFDAQLTDGLWLRLAAHANAMASRIGQGLAGIAGVSLLHPVEANELFVLMPEAVIAGLEASGFLFYRWPTDEGPCIRLVTAFDSDAEGADGLVAAIRTATR